jgi:hypothetical protein
MRQVEKFYNFFIPALNRAHNFKRVNQVLTVKLKDEEVMELGRDNLHVVFPKEYSVVNIHSSPMKTESAWLISGVVKDWECD